MFDFTFLDELCPKHRLKKLREQQKQLFNGRCAYCGCKPDYLTLDHVIPKTNGGSNDFSNLLPCCSHCNNSKGSQELWDWWQKQPFYRPEQVAKVKTQFQKWDEECDYWENLLKFY